jgi:MarR family 2-MHQ and catechol resistance regulon transcriptional repressor
MAATTPTQLFDDARITSMGLLSEAYLGLMGRLACQIAEHKLSPVEFEMLLRLSRSPDCRLRMTDLSAQTSLTASGVTRVVDRLERESLVTREACASDRRSLYAALTQSGRARIAAILPGHIALIEQWFTGRLTPEQLEAMLTGLRVIRDAVRPNAAAGSTRTAQPPALATHA